MVAFRSSGGNNLCWDSSPSLQPWNQPLPEETFWTQVTVLLLPGAAAPDGEGMRPPLDNHWKSHSRSDKCFSRAPLRRACCFYGPTHVYSDAWHFCRIVCENINILQCQTDQHKINTNIFEEHFIWPSVLKPKTLLNSYLSNFQRFWKKTSVYVSWGSNLFCLN